MGTLVQAPERASVQIGGLSPVDRPAKGGGLGSFLEGILPAVNEELEIYDKESRARVMALGQNDKLNNVMNEVGILDRQNYAHGRTYQTIVNGQILLAQKFQEEIYNADPNTFEPEELLRKGREFTNSSVNNIYDSALPSDIKEKMYEAQLKENATYMKAVDAKIKQITADNGAKTRTNQVAELTKNLREGSYTVEEQIQLLDSFYEKDELLQRSLDPNAKIEDVTKGSTESVKSALTLILADIETNGQPEDLVKLDQLNDLADHLMPRDLNLAMQVKTKAQAIGADIRKNQEARIDYNTSNFLNARAEDPTLWNDTQATLTRVGALFQDGSISYPERVRQATRILAEHSKNQVKVLNAEVVLDPLSSSPSEYRSMGKSEGQYEDDVISVFLKQEPSNSGIGYLKALDFFSKHAEYSADGIKKASAGIFSTLTGYARMSDQEVANDPHAQMRKDQFDILSKMYQRSKGENMSKAYDLLSGVKPEYVDAFASIFETGKALEDVRELFKNPVTTQQRFADIERVVNDTAGITKALSLGSEFFGGDDGQGTNSLSDGAEQFYVGHVATHMKGNKSYYAGTAAVTTPTGAIAAFRNAGGFIKSERGLSSIVMDLGVSNQVQNWTVKGSAQKLNTSYFSRAVDVERLRIARANNVDWSNVMAFSDATGQQMHFEVYKSKGITGKGEAVLVNTGAVLMGNLKDKAQELHRRDSEKQNSPAGQDSKYMNTRIGQASITDFKTGKGFNVKVSSDYARAFGNNLEMGTIVVNHFQEMEHFVNYRTQTKDANSGNISYVYGMGMTEATARSMDKATGSTWERQLIAAQGNPQKTMDIQGQFMKAYYKDLNKDLKTVGLPAPSDQPYKPILRSSFLLVADAKWHSGTSSGIAKAMNAKSYKEGRRIMQGLSIYNRSKLGSKRNLWMESALEQHYRIRGVK